MNILDGKPRGPHASRERNGPPPEASSINRVAPVDLLVSAIIFAILFGVGMIIGFVWMMWYWAQ